MLSLASSISRAPQRPVPRWLTLAHERSQRIGLQRLIVECSLVVSAVALLLAHAVSPLAGLSLSAWHSLVILTVCSALVAGYLGTVIPVVQSLSVARLRMRKIATHDPTTGIVNRRHFTQMAFREWERCRRYRSGAALLMVDADHFAAIEEEHGKAAGDAVMRAIALTCDGLLRKPDLLGRYTGDALVIFLPHTDLLGAIDVAERLRVAIAAAKVPWPKKALRVTLSVGVATLGEQHLSLNSLVMDAEAALHEAQRAGRNCVRTAPAPANRSGRAYPVMPN